MFIQPAHSSGSPSAELTAARGFGKPGKRLDIQGLRAVAVALVVLFHAGIPGVGGGYVGVDVFFVISGFLISTHLLEALQSRGGVGFGAFYARRARRLLPAAFAVIVLTVVAAAIWVSPPQFDAVVRDAIAAVLYVPNIVFAYRATDYLADVTPSLFMHYWSLGVEEQFYLIWPAVLLGLFARFGLRGRMAAAIATVSAVSFVLCVWLTDFSQPNAFFTPFARLWEFGLGALVAFAVLGRDRLFGDRIGALAGWAGLAAIVAGGVLFSTATEYPGYAVAMPVAGTALLIAAGPVRWGPVVILGLRPFTWLGDISYSVYLVHWPLLVIPLAATGYLHALPMSLRLLIVAACIPLAWLLYTYVEQPGQRVGWLNPARPGRTLKAAVAGMAAVIAAVFTVAGLHNPVLDAGRPAAPPALSLKPLGTPFVPNNLTPRLAVALSDKPITYINGCHQNEWPIEAQGCIVGTNPQAPLVALFGDSHAAHWYPALAVLANQGLIRLENQTKSNCPPEQIEVRHLPRCDIWRRAAIEKIASDKPAVILLASWGSKYVKALDNPTTRWRKALADTLAHFPSESRVAVFADNPGNHTPAVNCLGLFVNDALRCAFPRSTAFDKRVRQAEQDLAATGAFTYLDYSDYFCNDTVCPAILGNTLVYRDSNHLTVDFSTAFAPVVGADVMSLVNRSSSPAHADMPADSGASAVANKSARDRTDGSGGQ